MVLILMLSRIRRGYAPLSVAQKIISEINLQYSVFSVGRLGAGPFGRIDWHKLSEHAGIFYEL
jgi:hypothetical protein